jgi:hypothetical protein
MEIALKITQLPKKNKRRPRIAVITHGQNPVILAKGKRFFKSELKRARTFWIFLMKTNSKIIGVSQIVY